MFIATLIKAVLIIDAKIESHLYLHTIYVYFFKSYIPKFLQSRSLTTLDHLLFQQDVSHYVLHDMSDLLCSTNVAVLNIRKAGGLRFIDMLSELS